MDILGVAFNNNLRNNTHVNNRIQRSFYSVSSCNDEIIDSFQIVVACENFSKPYSEDHWLAVLLTQSF